MNSRRMQCVILFGVAVVLFLWAVAGHAGRREFWLTPPKSDTEEYMVPPPPFTEGIFPCSECHSDMKPNPRRRELKEEHTNIQLKNHAEHERWCLDCHDLKNRDRLRLVSGELVDFNHSYRLCGQCHGDKYRDWRMGIHGKRTGEWNGRKEYLLCAHCHNPHNPRFEPIALRPPPERPENIR